MTTPWTTLIDAQTVAGALDREDLVVLDCRFSLAAPEAGPAAYAASHLPGALYAHLDRDLSDHRKRGGGRHPWPDAADFNARLGDWGITADHQAVAYDDGDGAHAARLWFLLRAIGHRRAAVLDGGWKRWTDLGLPTQTGAGDVMRVARTGDFDDSRLLDAAQVQAHLARGGMLVDARAGERFRGEVEPIDRVAGHVPGAVNRPYAENLVDGRFKPREQLAREFGALLGAHPASDVVAMCGSGVTACHHLLAMEHAGLPGAKLFTGSWSGWIEDPQRPVATGA
jgi:thiosulfate/3-mercaptopyruvate sulfurtransferase